MHNGCYSILLEEGELCVCDIVTALDMIQPKVSFHLGVLREAGLIKDRRQGKWIHYSLDESDIFRRFLILSVLERIAVSLIQEDNKRLKEFLKMKKVKGEIIALKVKKGCCESESLSKEVKHG